MEDGSNAGRTLDAIADEIHRCRSASTFDIGKLLIEADKVCEHGEWGDWLKREFQWSHDTARNYMNAQRLAEKYENIRNLRVPITVIYDLANDVNEHTPEVVDALVRATADGSRLSLNAAGDVVRTTYQRIEYGDYPEAALAAMAGVDGEPWGDAAIAAIKAARPTTEAEAEAIVDRAQQAYEAEHSADAADVDEESTDDSSSRDEQPEEREDDRESRDVDDGAAGAEPEPEDEDDDEDEEERLTANPLVVAWTKASPKLRSEFVRARWPEITEARTGISPANLHGNGSMETHENRWVEEA
jgi:Protein of unknown function (DUF3102)